MNDICGNCLAELTAQDQEEDLQCEQCDKPMCVLCWPICDECIEAMYEGSYLYDETPE